MPYIKVGDLPDRVKNNLPDHAQEIYLEAYNNAWAEYAKPQERRSGATREETAHRVAWAAVKKKYEKDELTGEWRSKDEN
jgi:cation transport regulator